MVVKTTIFFSLVNYPCKNEASIYTIRQGLGKNGIIPGIMYKLNRVAIFLEKWEMKTPSRCGTDP
jgi:hypothetical protein